MTTSEYSTTPNDDSEQPVSPNDDAARCEQCQSELAYVLGAHEGGGLRYTVSCPCCRVTYYDFSAPPLRRSAPASEAPPEPPRERRAVCTVTQLAALRRTHATL